MNTDIHDDSLESKDLILAARGQMDESMIAADAEHLEALLGEGFSLTHMTGYVQPKAEWLDEIRRGSMRYHSIRRSSSSVDVDGARAVVITRDIVDATIWGSRANWRLQMTTSLSRQDNSWVPTRSVATTW
ncbi:hypothetical protein ABID81_001843 [Frigoribacterium sp. PvP054]|jgi:hypothetical protein|uniref:nuclear transport factor 2 family protein n=1 Tax=Frigoribacterium sp. PvP054 TaxID=3156438 RepID=UPI0033915D66